MSYKYGFELEGFFMPKGRAPKLPPKDYPTDGFPGIVELRTRGGKSLLEAYAGILAEYVKYSDVEFSKFETIFGGEERAKIRRRYTDKTAWDIRNLYGKPPRLLGNRTIASLQINISMVNCKEFTNKDGVLFPTRYGLLDIPRIVRSLDEEFAAEIKEAKRQPGEYCVKDSFRLEYRSLPNFAFELNPAKAKPFLARIERCVKGEE